MPNKKTHPAVETNTLKLSGWGLCTIPWWISTGGNLWGSSTLTASCCPPQSLWPEGKGKLHLGPWERQTSFRAFLILSIEGTRGGSDWLKATSLSSGHIRTCLNQGPNYPAELSSFHFSNSNCSLKDSVPSRELSDPSFCVSQWFQFYHSNF